MKANATDEQITRILDDFPVPRTCRVPEHPPSDDLVSFVMDELGKDENARIDRHLASCEGCTQRAEHLFDLLESWRGAGAQSRLERLRDELRRAVGCASEPASEARGGLVETIRRFLSKNEIACVLDISGFLKPQFGLGLPNPNGWAMAEASTEAPSPEKRLLAEGQTPDGSLVWVVDEIDGGLRLRLASTVLELEGTRVIVRAGRRNVGQVAFSKEVKLRRKLTDQVGEEVSLSPLALESFPDGKLDIWCEML